MSGTALQAPGVTLVPYAPRHDAQTVEWLNAPDIRSTFGISQAVTPASHRAWMESAHDTLVWAINGADGVHCGNVLLRCNARHRSAYFQVYIGVPAMRGRGLGKVVLDLVLAHAFTDLDLHRVWLHTFPDNRPAERLYAKAGFVNEGVERESILREGSFLSQRRWSLLAPEWRAKAEVCLP
jgi:RimJ/RimL family protein N-acetyltransferase